MTAACTCPTCGQPMRAGTDVKALTGLARGPVSRAILDTLVESYPASIEGRRLAEAVWGDDPDGGPNWPAGSLFILMRRLRLKLGPLGWTITSTGPGRGGASFRLAPLEA
ncbi:helix-turn-helix domain-containing protein [Ancylobacter sp.]|uniref:helix-turn-helix domain-containing protein n=1 Tax=Ancylobacter sp. TaxID=1872567 RepID=UPI003D12D7FE